MRNLIWFLPLLVGCDQLSRVAEGIPTDGLAVTIGAVIYDLIRRYLPSKKPRSLLHDLAAILRAVSLLAGRIGDYLDAILGQKIQKK